MVDIDTHIPYSGKVPGMDNLIPPPPMSNHSANQDKVDPKDIPLQFQRGYVNLLETIRMPKKAGEYIVYANTATNRNFRKRPELPDSPPHLYGENRGVNDKGHQGPHCEEGAVIYNAATNSWSGTPGCVLFGATGTSAASSPLDYCGDCTPVARKLDLSF